VLLAFGLELAAGTILAEVLAVLVALADGDGVARVVECAPGLALADALGVADADALGVADADGVLLVPL